MQLAVKRFVIGTVVFICGAVVMIFEIVGSRVLGPYLGTSTFTWTSLIGVILGSLSLGYWFGGRMADRKPSLTVLSWIILISAGFILVSTLLKDVLLKALPDLIPGIRGQSVVASILIFAPASILLGMVSPYAVRLKITSLSSSGATVGKLYAISTIGSIAGTFLAGFFLIPALGTNQVLFTLAFILAVVSVLLFITSSKPRQSVSSILMMAVAVVLSLVYYKARKPFIDLDTRYNRIWIYDAAEARSGQAIRFMRINNERCDAMYLDSEGPVFEYARYMRLAEYFCPGLRSGLVLGGGAYTWPRNFVSMYPEAVLDVVEIDPGLTRLARQHFRLTDHERIRIFHDDARTFLNRSTGTYDVLYVDVFKSLYALPWHLASVEAVSAMHRVLADDGMAIVNLISAIEGEKSAFLAAEFHTYRKVFPDVRVFAVDDPGQKRELQNIVLVALKRPVTVDGSTIDPVIAGFLGHEITPLVPESGLLLTDNYAPVDNMINKIIR